VEVHVLLVKSRTKAARGCRFQERFYFQVREDTNLSWGEIFIPNSAARKKMISRAAANSQQEKK